LKQDSELNQTGLRTGSARKFVANIGRPLFDDSRVASSSITSPVLHQDAVVRLKRSTLIRGSLIVMVFLIPLGAGCYSVKGAEEKNAISAFKFS
jgi:hypothetical protein